MNDYRYKISSFALLCGLLFAADAKSTEDSPGQALIQFADNLGVTYQVADNQSSNACSDAGLSAPCFTATISLRMPDTLPEGKWQLHFSHLTPVIKALSSDFTVTHENGDHHILTPMHAFNGGERVSIALYAAGWHVSRSDVLPNWYVTQKGVKAQVITATIPVINPATGINQPRHAGTWLTAAQYRRGQDDALPLADGDWLYQHYANIRQGSGEAASYRTIPQVKQMTLKGKSVSVSSGLSIDLPPGHPAEKVLDDAGIRFSENGLPVNLAISDSLSGSEAYEVTINENGINVKAASAEGQHYALLTLAQLYNRETASFLQGSISDAPAYDYRGMHIDIARNFPGEKALFTLIEQMYRYKLNTLHLHLADDESWRLEIASMPALTDTGAWRCADGQPECLMPSLGSGPDKDVPVNGYLSEEAFIRLLKFASARNIRVIPSIDMPGHARAAIKSLPPELALTDAKDTTVYRSIQHYNDNTINLCVDGAYTFVGRVLDSLAASYSKAGVAFDTFHVGADETAGAWLNSPACEKLLGRQLTEKDGHALLGRFLTKVQDMTRERGITLAGWSDGLSQLPDARKQDDLLVTFWHTLAAGGAKEANQWLKTDASVVLALPDVLYFDFPYRNHPQEPGFYWASKDTDTFKVFQFTPQLLPLHQYLWSDRMGHPYTQQNQLADKPVEGIQGQIWTEVIRSPATLEYMLYPRLFALAERAWHTPSWIDAGRKAIRGDKQAIEDVKQQQRLDFAGFSRKVASYSMPQLAQSGINFRLPPPGINRGNNTVAVNSPYEGLIIEGKNAQGNWTQVSDKVEISDFSQFRTRLPGTDKVSEATEVAAPRAPAAH